jgi:hypothetical protein
VSLQEDVVELGKGLVAVFGVRVSEKELVVEVAYRGKCFVLVEELVYVTFD